jgi:hypothetical protein
MEPLWLKGVFIRHCKQSRSVYIRHLALRRGVISASFFLPSVILILNKEDGIITTLMWIFQSLHFLLWCLSWVIIVDNMTHLFFSNCVSFQLLPFQWMIQSIYPVFQVRNLGLILISSHLFSTSNQSPIQCTLFSKESLQLSNLLLTHYCRPCPIP